LGTETCSRPVATGCRAVRAGSRTPWKIVWPTPARWRTSVSGSRAPGPAAEGPHRQHASAHRWRQFASAVDRGKPAGGRDALGIFRSIG